MTDISKAIASQLHLDRDRVEATLGLLDDGATIPFISRYRKERTGGMNELQIRDRAAELKSTLVKGKESEARNYRSYFDYSCRLSRIPSHSYLAVRRAEREGLLRVSLSAPDDEIVASLTRVYV